MRQKYAVPFVIVVGTLIFGVLSVIFTRYPMLPEAASAQAHHVDNAWHGLLVVEGVIYSLVMAFIFFCLWRFRAHRREEQGDRIHGSRGHFVEAVWVLSSVALTLGLAALGSQELRALIRDPEADIDIEVRASQFSWEFYYPRQQAYGSKLFMEIGKRHRIILTSQDVVHSFWVPEFRIKQDAVPGKVISMILTPTKLGEYTLLCNQLCGWGHTDMTAQVEVLAHEDFDKNVGGADSF
ncbi:MAG: cytochrome c oxidase subunit II [Elusimicrobia bacterium]|nr:cytochrome c oxidase subunit II [Elusimicrobiota bacterium]